MNVNSGNIIIKNYVTFGQNVSLLTGTHDYNIFGKARSETKAPVSWNDIVIEDGVWIASNVTILWPCHIWENAVIASGAVVTKDVPSYTVFWWVPAKLIKIIPH